MSLYAFTVLGIFLLFAPWSPVWDQATRALLPATVGAFARSGWARGLVSALGGLDLIVALQVGRELWDSMRLGSGDRSPD
jgi:hypothetical protein